MWVIDRDGRSFIVNLHDNSWKEVSTPELKSRNCFKRISATNSCAWAINANQQPCLFVHSTQVCIRNRAETWENQRYGWIHGWSEKSVRIAILLVVAETQYSLDSSTSQYSLSVWLLTNALAWLLCKVGRGGRYGKHWERIQGEIQAYIIKH